LNEVIEDVSKMLRRLIGEDVRLASDLAQDLGCIRADASQLQQIIVNLAVNARDAMPGGGTLHIRTDNATTGVAMADSERSRGTGSVPPPPGDYVRLSMTDTGMGMTEEVRSKIFEPFFTTKAAGRGTGLGLATCQNIVAQSNGYVEVQTAPGLGTTFHIYFPRVQEQSDAIPVPARAALPCGKETILVVDDDASVRQLTVCVLQRLGYSVLEAEDGESALALAKANSGCTLHLIITDVVMPKMSGTDLALSIRAIYPKLKILFISGYPTHILDDPGVVRQNDLFVTKPLLPATLALQVREILDR
jgi:CheY-like chemotaxis protein